MASSEDSPHISDEGFKLQQTLGLSGESNSLHRLSCVSWMQRTPAGFPSGIPGILEDMEGAMQQAPQPMRQFILTPRKQYFQSFYHGMSQGAKKGRPPRQCLCLGGLYKRGLSAVGRRLLLMLFNSTSVDAK